MFWGRDKGPTHTARQGPPGNRLKADPIAPVTQASSVASQCFQVNRAKVSCDLAATCLSRLLPALSHLALEIPATPSGGVS